MTFLERIVELFFTKKKIMAYIAAVVIAVVAYATGMSFDDVKAAIADAPHIDVPARTPTPVPVVVPVPTPDPALAKELDGH